MACFFVNTMQWAMMQCHMEVQEPSETVLNANELNLPHYFCHGHFFALFATYENTGVTRKKCDKSDTLPCFIVAYSVR